MNEEQMKYVANLISQDLEKDKEIKRLNKELEETKQIHKDMFVIAIKNEMEVDRLNNIISIKTTYIENLLKLILKSTDIKIQKEVYEYGIEYDKKLRELKEGIYD